MSDLISSPAKAKPFLKWAGGKGQLIPQLEPFFLTEFAHYHEPFVGGGAVFFHFASRHPGLKACLSDGNPELINCYEIVRDRVADLMAALDEHAVRFQREGATYYYAVRALHDLKKPVERAARMVFLNKTCFNGLWRVNSRGRFNVPIGSQLPEVFYDAGNLRAASAVLRDARLQVADFTVAMAEPQAGDFVYLDPPYVPVSRTADFTGYTVGGFGVVEQQKLAALVVATAARGATMVLSNSDTPETRRLYAAFELHTVSCRRSINSVATGRGRVPELVVVARGRARALPRRGRAGSLAPTSQHQ